MKKIYSITCYWVSDIQTKTKEIEFILQPSCFLTIFHPFVGHKLRYRSDTHRSKVCMRVGHSSQSRQYMLYEWHSTIASTSTITSTSTNTEQNSSVSVHLLHYGKLRAKWEGNQHKLWCDVYSLHIGEMPPGKRRDDTFDVMEKDMGQCTANTHARGTFSNLLLFICLSRFHIFNEYTNDIYYIAVAWF